MTLQDYQFDFMNESDDQSIDVEQLLKGGVIPEPLDDGVEISGFRVQLISTREEEEARSVMRNAVISFKEQVYRQFDDPYYKIRVGDFKSRYEATQVQEKAIKLGFHEAWVVRAMIHQNPINETSEESE